MMSTKGMITEDIADNEQACNTLARIIYLCGDLAYELQTPGCEAEQNAVNALKARAIAEYNQRTPYRETDSAGRISGVGWDNATV